MPSPYRSPAVPVALSAASLGFLATVASVPRSTLQPVLPPGASPAGPFAWLARAVGLDGVHGAALGTVGAVALVLAAAAFLYAVREAWRGRLSTRAVVVLAVAAHVAVLTLPLLVSRDAYSYLAYGRIVAVHHANPYVLTPADFPLDQVSALVGPKWLSTPAVYGPLFTSIAAVVAQVLPRIDAAVAAFRLLAAAASLGTLALIGWSARRLAPERAAFAVAVFGLNPVVLFQSVASGHNDLLVALAVAAALALVLGGHDGLAVAALSMGALVKATAALPLLLLLVWIVARRPPGERLAAALRHAGIAAAIGAVLAAPYFQLRDPTLGMAELAGHEGWLAPSRLFRRILDAVSGDTLGIVARVAFAGLLAAVVIALAGRVWKEAAGPAGLGAAWGWALLSLMLLGPVLIPWYVTWALPLAFLLPREPRGVLLATSTALAVSTWSAEPSRFHAVFEANLFVGHYVITPLVVIALGVLLRDLWRRLTSGAPLEQVSGAEAARPGSE
ncbi:MAG: DUF2029 domain-containing protein [Actinobacteria bacterium]|nr:DUF2029 domain-containing protein [Actinomycetota bacterium]